MLEHLVIENRSHHFVFSAYRSRNAVVCKAEEEALHHGRCQCSQQGTDDRLPEGLDRLVSHDSGHDHKLLVDKSHGIQDQHKGNGKRINHISEQQPVESIDIK